MLTFRLHAAHIYWCCKSVPSGSYIYKEPNKLPNLKFSIKPRAEINKRANVHELIRMENCVYISTKLYLIANHCSLRCCQKWGQIPLPSFHRFWNFPAAPPLSFLLLYVFQKKSLISNSLPPHPEFFVRDYLFVHKYIHIRQYMALVNISPIVYDLCPLLWYTREGSHQRPTKCQLKNTQYHFYKRF